MDKYTGKRLDGRYEIHELIGVGGMAVVYRAYDTIDDRVVAIKILKDEFSNNADFIRRFKNESKAIAVLSHPNIVKVYDVSIGDRIQYIVMEYIDGITLKEYLGQQKVIKWKEAIHFTVQILRALQHAHEKGIVHRDIKPQNIMLLSDGTIKVTDFGIARFARGETRTMTDKAIGSVHYIAPEQARGDRTDEKADIYSVGVMLYEMLTGRLPFEADNAVSVAIMQLQADPTPPRDINPSIPEGLEEITLKAMQKDPAQRYQSAAGMLNDIEAFRRNPSINFQYKYFVDEKPTKYMDAIDSVRSSDTQSFESRREYSRYPVYQDPYDYEEAEEAAPRRRSPAVMIVAGVAVAFLLAALGFGLVAVVNHFTSSEGYEDVDLPNFVGQYLSDIEADPQYEFQFFIEYENDATQPEGIVLDQNPHGNMKVKENSEVTLVVNSGGKMVTVPANLVGLTEAEARESLRGAGLTPEVTEVYDDQTAEGYVSRCEPAEGSQALEGSTVRLYISRGPALDEVDVPAVIGKDLEAARADILAAGLVVGEVRERDDSDQPENTVVETDPLPGVPVAEGSSVTLYVSSGKQSEKTIEVYVQLPGGVDQDIELKAYVDGILSETNTVNPSMSDVYQMSFTGSSGQQTLTIQLNGQKYKVYTLDFDTGNPTETESYEFTPEEEEPESSDTSSQGGHFPLYDPDDVPGAQGTGGGITPN